VSVVAEKNTCIVTGKAYKFCWAVPAQHMCLRRCARLWRRSSLGSINNSGKAQSIPHASFWLRRPEYLSCCRHVTKLLALLWRYRTCWI